MLFAQQSDTNLRNTVTALKQLLLLSSFPPNYDNIKWSPIAANNNTIRKKQFHDESSSSCKTAPAFDPSLSPIVPITKMATEWETFNVFFFLSQVS